MVKETELYDIIGIQPSSTKDEIKKAYRNKAKILHPDKGGDPDQFKKLSSAYEILGNDDKKHIYDKHGKNGLKNNPDVSDDIFSDLFNMGGNTFNMFNMFTRGFSKNKTKPIVHNYNVTLEQLCTNKLVTLKYFRNKLCNCKSGSTTCTSCNGQGVKIQHIQLGPGLIQQIQQACTPCQSTGKINKGCDSCKNGVVEQSNKIELHLTPTMENGYKYIFKGEGHHISKNDLPGDFIVVLNYKKHTEFTTKNDHNLYLHKNISLKESLTGYILSITHPNGEQFSVNTTGQIIQPISTITYKGKGMSNKFDMIINFIIDFPKILDPLQIKTLKEIL